jgi:Fe-S-cluster containining protein
VGDQQTSSTTDAAIWDHLISVIVTKEFFQRAVTPTAGPQLDDALRSIEAHRYRGPEHQHVRFGKKDGVPQCMVYDCSQCDKPGQYSKETPVTLDDLPRIAKKINCDLETIFRDYLEPSACTSTGGLKLRRRTTCVFFRRGHHCKIRGARPMHCRFTPCPRKGQTEGTFECLYLGSGTIEEQYRHQVSLAVTRDYVTTIGTTFDATEFKACINRIDELVQNHTGFEELKHSLDQYRLGNRIAMP